MPKIKITEVDNTGSSQLDAITNVVYIPGATSNTSTTKPVLCETLSDLEKYSSDSETENDYKFVSTDVSFKLAKRCIALGMQVLYQGFVKNETTNSITISDNDWKLLQDKNLYDIRFLTTGAYAIPTKAMVACAEARGDCVALLDHSLDLEKKDVPVTSIRNFFAGTTTTTSTTSTKEEESTKGFLSKYAAAFTPWFKADIGINSVDKQTIPASFGYLFAYARSIQSNPTWYAVAGTFRGSITEMVDEPDRVFTTAEVEKLQGRTDDLEDLDDNKDFAINPIAYVRGYGYLIWGNRTTLKPSTDNELVASSFLNIRNLCSDIKKTLYAAAKRYTFEQNSNVLWFNFQSQLTPLLDRMVSGNGIETYTIERLETTKKARLAARVSITPLEGIEDFELDLYLEDSLEVVE